MTIESRINAINYNFNGTMGIYANDFHGNVIAMNEEALFETASCIKVPILATLLKEVKQKNLSLEEKMTYHQDNFIDGSGILRALTPGLSLSILDFATLMIIVSDNIATNEMIDLLGVDRVNETCEELGMHATKLHNKIDFSKYSQLGTTTPKDYAVIFERAYKGTLWSEDMSKLFIEILKKQHYNTMLTKALTPYYFDAEDTGDEEMLSIASKSGSMDACRNDGGIFFTPYGGYVLTILTKGFSDKLFYPEHETYKYGPQVSKLILEHYLSKEGRF